MMENRQEQKRKQLQRRQARNMKRRDWSQE